MIKKHLYSLCFLLLASSNLFAQIEIDTTAIELPPPPPEIETIYETAPAEAVEYEDDYNYGPTITNIKNELKTKTGIKVELNPDKPARYVGGTGALMKELQTIVVVPYNYSQNAKYAIIQVTVGKDSLLYNPKILQTEGNTYSKYAKEAIQQLSLSFAPATKKGKPVDSILLIPIRFENATKEINTDTDY